MSVVVQYQIPLMFRFSEDIIMQVFLKVWPKVHYHRWSMRKNIFPLFSPYYSLFHVYFPKGREVLSLKNFIPCASHQIISRTSTLERPLGVWSSLNLN